MISRGLKIKSALCFSLLILNAVNLSAADSSLVPLETGLQNLISRLSRSIVTIEVSKSNSQSLPASRTDNRIVSIVASGVVYDSAGYILVAASSVIERENIIVIADGCRVPARLVGVDYQTGLALIQAERLLGMPVEALENYRCIGQLVVAVGNSFGLNASPSLGFCAGARTDGSLQFSAAISSGTIGGGIFDLTGKLIGAITGGISNGSQTGAGLAVPASEIPAIVEYLRIYGDRQAGYLGVTISEIEVTPAIELRSANLLAGGIQPPVRIINQSLFVTDVVAKSPAAFGRIAPGDLIISINGDEVSSAVDFLYQIRKAHPGSIIQLGFIRQNQLLYADIEIGRRANLSSDTQLSGFFEKGLSQPANSSIHEEFQALKKAMQLLEQRISDNK